MMKYQRLAALAVLMAAWAGPIRADEPKPLPSGQSTKQRTSAELSPATFEKLHALIKPDPKVSFERIPWTTSLWEARQKAAAEDKPIVLWSGDPLPLGVT